MNSAPEKSKKKSKSRKAVLLRLLDGVGNYRGIDLSRTPGEDAAICIAMRLIEDAPLKQLDKAAAKTKNSEPFWSKQW